MAANFNYSTIPKMRKLMLTKDTRLTSPLEVKPLKLYQNKVKIIDLLQKTKKLYETQQTHRYIAWMSGFLKFHES
jgi:hypothetical protein